MLYVCAAPPHEPSHVEQICGAGLVDVTLGNNALGEKGERGRGGGGGTITVKLVQKQ